MTFIQTKWASQLLRRTWTKDYSSLPLSPSRTNTKHRRCLLLVAEDTNEQGAYTIQTHTHWSSSRKACDRVMLAGAVVDANEEQHSRDQLEA